MTRYHSEGLVMDELPPTMLDRDAIRAEKTYLRQLDMMLRDARHSVASIQSLMEMPRARFMKRDHLKALDDFIGHAVRLNEEIQRQVKGEPS